MLASKILELFKLFVEELLLKKTILLIWFNSWQFFINLVVLWFMLIDIELFKKISIVDFHRKIEPFRSPSR